MRFLAAITLTAIVFSGCALGPPATLPPLVPIAAPCSNPALVPGGDPQCVWEAVVDVVDDYFRIEREEPVRLIGNVITEGRLDTFPEVSPTIFEPWRHDTADRAQRIENTLQSMRRQATVRVIPTSGGYWVEVVVLKYLEDVLRPEQATAGAATFRYDASLTRVVNPQGGPDVGRGWILQGRDVSLEQRILEHVQARLGRLGGQQLPAAAPGVPGVPCAPGVPPVAPASATGPIAGSPGLSCNPAGPSGEPMFSAVDEGYQAYPGWQLCSCPVLNEFAQDVSLDYQHFYSCRGLTLVGLGLGTGAVLANTRLDQELQDWYQDGVRSRGTDDFAKAAKVFGDGNIFIPVYAGVTLLRPYLAGWPAGAVIGDWGDRCLRSVVVGGPPVLALQWILGASRPSEGAGSCWKPFDDTHGVSGHAFIGAVTFINAAKMSDNLGAKLLWYALSTLPAWSRINDNDHYLSQAVLGWWFGYLAATAVDNSEQSKRQFAIIPLASHNGIGVGAVCQW